jgi:DNA-directed RNA polymerase beta subunit
MFSNLGKKMEKEARNGEMRRGDHETKIKQCQPFFSINGIYQIVINQILLSASIYYRSELYLQEISIYTRTIISDWGGKSELAIDKKERIWARVSRKQKISILVLSNKRNSR